MFWVLSYFSEKFLLILGAAQCAGSKPRAPAFLSACPQKYSLDNLKLRPFRMYIVHCTTWKNSTPGKCVRSRISKLRILVTLACKSAFLFIIKNTIAYHSINAENITDKRKSHIHHHRVHNILKINFSRCFLKDHWRFGAGFWRFFNRPIKWWEAKITTQQIAIKPFNIKKLSLSQPTCFKFDKAIDKFIKATIIAATKKGLKTRI